MAESWLEIENKNIMTEETDKGRMKELEMPVI